MTDFDWVEAVGAGDDRFAIGAPVEAANREHAEAVVGIAFPPTLRTMYEAADGIFDKSGEWYVIWPLARLISDNAVAHEVEGSLRHEYVGFGDDGTGNPFCLRRGGGDTVYYWNPIDQEATWLADSVHEFWMGWVGNALPPY